MMGGPIGNWDDLAPWWRSEVATDPVYREDVAPMVDRLIGPSGGTVLELGCGDGQWLSRLADRGAPVFGCDRSEQLLNDARAICPVALCSLPSLAWVRDEAVDVTLSVFVLDLLGDVASFFAEARRVVAPGGALVVVINHPIFTAPRSGPFMDPDLEVFWRWGEYLSDGASRIPAGGHTVTMHHRSVAHLLTAAADAGWRLEELLEVPLGRAAIEREPSYAGQESIPRFLGARWVR
jgi:SAM-dependent methyltransferase